MSRMVLACGVVACLAVGMLAGCASDNKGTGTGPGMTVVGGPGAPGTFGGAAGFGAFPTNPVGNSPAGTGTPTMMPVAPIAPTGPSLQPTPGAGQVLPCNVATVVGANCQKCHGATPVGGAPMSLMTYADFQKPAVTQPTLKVYQLAKTRINDKAKPMPQGGIWATPTDFTVLDGWLGAGATAGTAADTACAATKPTMMGAGGTGGGTTSAGSGDGTYGPLTPAPGETCYDLAVHASTTSSTDPMPLTVDTGEFYEQFYYKVPWPKGTLGTRYGTQFDNEKVLHHWLLFTSSSGNPDGYHVTAPLPTLIGDNASLVAGWAVGGSNLALPDDAAFELPDSSVVLNVQWHFYNSTGTVQTDHSAVRVCTLPPGARPHVVTISWIGNEDLGGNKWTFGAGMPAHTMSTFSGTCNPLREGMNATDPIHIVGFWPHMHKLGTQMQAIVNHKGGASEVVFDKPFDFSHQVHFLQNYDLMPGDTITAKCFFNNTTDQGVPFGESSDTEMCYNFTMAWPPHSLENHVSSLIGATNTCW